MNATRQFRFIHAADLHIDSPLRGLEYLDGSPLDRLRAATRAACERLIDACLRNEVAFLIVAGDVFDGPWLDVTTGLWVARQFRRLEKAGIGIYLVRGNHDAASQVRHALRWPDNVREFAVDAAESMEDPRTGAVLHGQGFATQAVMEDLAAGYPAAWSGRFNIGVLHTSLTGDAQHDTYAPTSLDTLLSRGYDYWALGHIHQRRVVHERPYIAYAGNTQGRHIRECGAKGCLLVTVQDRSIQDVQFLATDDVRWEHLQVDAAGDLTLSQLYEQIRAALQELQACAAGRFLAVRVSVRGACAAHWDLAEWAAQDEAVAEIRNLAAALDDVWIEHVLLHTSPPIDIAALRRGRDLVGDVLRELQRCATDEQSLRLLLPAFSSLDEKASLELRQAGISLEDPQNMRRWLQRAEGLLVGMLRAEQTP
jgi:DNA repair protein SbcD/Mre11